MMDLVESGDINTYTWNNIIPDTDSSRSRCRLQMQKHTSSLLCLRVKRVLYCVVLVSYIIKYIYRDLLKWYISQLREVYFMEKSSLGSRMPCSIIDYSLDILNDTPFTIFKDLIEFLIRYHKACSFHICKVYHSHLTIVKIISC